MLIKKQNGKVIFTHWTPAGVVDREVFSYVLSQYLYILADGVWDASDLAQQIFELYSMREVRNAAAVANLVLYEALYAAARWSRGAWLPGLPGVAINDEGIITINWQDEQRVFTDKKAALAGLTAMLKLD